MFAARLVFHQDFAEAVELLYEERLELLGAFVESRLPVVVVAAVVEDLCHVFDEVVETIVFVVEDFRLDLLEIYKLKVV